MEMQSNPHIKLQYQQKIRALPYHEIVADLAMKYSVEGDEILDVGTGGANIPALIGASRIIDVADAYESCLDGARSRTRIRDGYLIDEDNFDIAERIKGRSYAVVTMSHVLEHMRDPVQAITDVLGLISPGGHLVLAVPNPVTPIGILNVILQRRISNLGHTVTWDRSHWMNFLERIMKLDVVEYASDYLPIAPAAIGGAIRPIERLLVKAVPWMAFSHIAVVRKAETEPPATKLAT